MKRFVEFGVVATKKNRKAIVEYIYSSLQNNPQKELNLTNRNTDNFADSIHQILNNQMMKELSSKDSTITKKITEETLEFINKTKKKMLSSSDPFLKEKELLNHFKHYRLKHNKLKEFFKIWKSVSEYVGNNYQENEIPIEFYRKEFQESLEESNKLKKEKTSFESIKEHFIDTWEKLILKKRTQIELDFIDKERKEFCKDLYEKIEELIKLQEILEPITNELGRLWDLSAGEWHKTRFDILKRYADILKNDKSIQELAEMLGRMRKAEKEYEEELFLDKKIKQEWKIEYALKSELVGIVESDDLSCMLPSETVLLSDKVTEDIFYKKFAEKKLQTFDYQSKTLFLTEEIFENKRKKVREDKKGPFIICVDTSGSMHGTPEMVAKTLCFAILKIAVRDNRKCYLISFSTGIQVLNLTDLKESLDKVIDFLLMSFHGGTDASPAMEEALKMLQAEDYKKADVIMVSDFVMSDFSSNVKKQIKDAKQNHTKFHSLVIGESANSGVIEEFDSNWSYNTKESTGVLKLLKNIRKL